MLKGRKDVGAPQALPVQAARTAQPAPEAQPAQLDLAVPPELPAPQALLVLKVQLALLALPAPLDRKD